VDDLVIKFLMIGRVNFSQVESACEEAALLHLDKHTTRLGIRGTAGRKGNELTPFMIIGIRVEECTKSACPRYTRGFFNSLVVQLHRKQL